MKTILTTLLLLALVGCDQTRVKTDNSSSVSPGYNEVGEQFIASFVKNNPQAAYSHLDRSMTSRLSLDDFQQMNSRLFQRYGKPVSFNKTAQPMRSMRVLPNGGNQRVMTLWYPVKTTKDMSGALRLKLSFGNSRNPKIVNYAFMKQR